MTEADFLFYIGLFSWPIVFDFLFLDSLGSDDNAWVIPGEKKNVPTCRLTTAHMKHIPALEKKQADILAQQRIVS